MKSFYDLSFEDREYVLDSMTKEITYEIISGMFSIEFSSVENQKEYMRIMQQAGIKDSIRFAQYAMHKHDGIRTEIAKLALIVCSNSMFDEDSNIIKQNIKEEAM